MRICEVKGRETHCFLSFFYVPLYLDSLLKTGLLTANNMVYQFISNHIERKKTMTITDSDYRYQPATTPKELAVPAKRKRRVTADAIPPTGTVALLQSATEVRQTLRDSLVQVNALIREVKVQRKQDRLLQTTMDSLRKLGLA